MAHFLVSDEKYRDLIQGEYGSSHRAKLRAGYRFGRVPGNPGRGSARHDGGTFRRVIEAIVNSKLRRIERELELRGIRIRDEN